MPRKVDMPNHQPDRPKAPSSMFWRGGWLWGRIYVGGVERRFSLNTSEIAIAEKRLEQRRRLEVEFAGRKADKIGYVSLTRPVKGLLPTVIYFIARSGFVKIGITNNLKGRMSSLQTAAPEPISLLFTLDGGASDEKRFHKQFAQYRETGEWFRLEGDLLDFCQRRVGKRMDAITTYEIERQNRLGTGVVIPFKRTAAGN